MTYYSKKRPDAGFITTMIYGRQVIHWLMEADFWLDDLRYLGRREFIGMGRTDDELKAMFYFGELERLVRRRKPATRQVQALCYLLALPIPEREFLACFYEDDGLQPLRKATMH